MRRSRCTCAAIPSYSRYRRSRSSAREIQHPTAEKRHMSSRRISRAAAHRHERTCARHRRGESCRRVACGGGKTIAVCGTWARCPPTLRATASTRRERRGAKGARERVPAGHRADESELSPCRNRIISGAVVGNARRRGGVAQRLAHHRASGPSRTGVARCSRCRARFAILVDTRLPSADSAGREIGGIPERHIRGAATARGRARAFDRHA